MKKLLLVSFSILLCLVASAQKNVAPADVYNLVFSDEFEGTTLDLAKWNIQPGIPSNQEKEYYTDGNKNIRVENGNLVIVGRKEVVSGRNYSSARINSQGKGFLKYGKFEARVSVPSGSGTWPAFWLMPQTNVYGGWPNSGEIDIMEHIGSDPRMTSHAVHTANKNGMNGQNFFNKQYNDNTENNFHLYSIIWEQDQIAFYIDNVQSVILYRNFVDDYKGWPFDQPFYVIFNLALGGTMGGGINDAIFNNPVEMKVDYVHIYQKANTALNTQQDSHIKVFPTFITDKINVKTDFSIDIKLFNSIGKLLLSKQIKTDETVDSSNLPNGIYLLKTGDKSFKLIK